MRPAALASLGLIGFLAVAGTAQAQPVPAAPAQSEPATAPAARTDGKPADGRATPTDGRSAPANARTPEARPAAPERTAAPRRRRPSYAACNRASQRRSLHGGARRRFLIRCRLGYERIQPGQPARTRP
ncbi:serine/threonine protein kinase [Methylobacterium terrae]|uniref:Serine/threonine protein kinase n=1 Tax=Methylobacterium terrae TaxID=2202827 RepID=A0A2U8WPE4_9HYPH|nr:serine/threonine protein kinase [Methylobacterium terrae]AWN47330.1 serine/threonine protein kinase [Methylobacterium terrae]